MRFATYWRNLRTRMCISRIERLVKEYIICAGEYSEKYIRGFPQEVLASVRRQQSGLLNALAKEVKPETLPEPSLVLIRTKLVPSLKRELKLAVEANEVGLSFYEHDRVFLKSAETFLNTVPAQLEGTRDAIAEGDYAFVKDNEGNACGLWLRDPAKADDQFYIAALLAKEGLSRQASSFGSYRVVPNNYDNKGGRFVMFGSAKAPGE